MRDEFKIHLSVSGVDQVNEEVGCLEVRFFFVNPEDSPWTFLELLDNIGNVL